MAQSRHRRPGRSRRRGLGTPRVGPAVVIGPVAVVVGVLASAVIVWQSSTAAFTGTTLNSANAFAAGSVSITDTRGGTAMFTTTALAPGDTNSGAPTCIGVQYTGTLTPSAIKIYTSGAQESNASGAYGTWANSTASELDDHLTMEILVSSADLNANPGTNCAPAGVGTFSNVTAAAPGTLMKTMVNTNTSFGTGLGSNWGTITANKWRVFKFIYTFSASAPDTAQNDGLKVNFVWEAQS